MALVVGSTFVNLWWALNFSPKTLVYVSPCTNAHLWCKCHLSHLHVAILTNMSQTHNSHARHGLVVPMGLEMKSSSQRPKYLGLRTMWCMPTHISHSLVVFTLYNIVDAHYMSWSSNISSQEWVANCSIIWANSCDTVAPERFRHKFKKNLNSHLFWLNSHPFSAHNTWTIST
jgi:hypothetical protein